MNNNLLIGLIVVFLILSVSIAIVFFSLDSKVDKKTGVLDSQIRFITSDISSMKKDFSREIESVKTDFGEQISELKKYADQEIDSKDKAINARTDKISTEVTRLEEKVDTITAEEVIKTWTGNAYEGIGDYAKCPGEKKIISGGCFSTSGTTNFVISGFGPTKSNKNLKYFDSWECDFTATQAGTYKYRIIAYCQ